MSRGHRRGIGPRAHGWWDEAAGDQFRSGLRANAPDSSGCLDSVGNSQAAKLSEYGAGETEAGELGAPFRFVKAATDPNDQGGQANLGARGGRDRRAEGSVLLFLGSSPFAPVIIIEVIGSGEFKQEDTLTVIVHKDGVRGEPLKPGDRRAGKEGLERG